MLDPKSHKAADHYLGITELYIGRANTNYLHGELDEVRIWNIARDAKDIKAIMNRRLSGQKPGLTGYYHFEDRNVLDRSGNEHHGTLHGDLAKRAPVVSPLSAYVCWASVGNDAIATTEPVVTHSWHHLAAVYKQSYALTFNGDDYGDAGNDSVLNITKNLTIEAFVKLDALGRKHGIVSKGIIDNGDDDDNVPYAFYIDEIGKLVLAFEDEDGTNYSYSSLTPLKAKTFYRIAVVRKIGKEKIEKKGTKTVKFTDDKGKEKTQTFDTIKSIEFQDYSDIRFYIDKNEHGYSLHEGKKPIGNTSPLYIGRSYIANQLTAQFQGTISELRVWNVARPKKDINNNLLGTEAGIIAWWRFEENSGNTAYDAKGTNHARMNGVSWVKNPDPKSSSFVIYLDAHKAKKATIPRPKVGSNQFTLGARKQTKTDYLEHFKGDLEEVRVWKTARRKEEILDNLFTRLKGEKEHLIANFSFEGIVSGEVKDSGLKSNHLKLPSASAQKPGEVLSTAPISNDTPQVRSAVAGIKTEFNEQISGRPAAAEYADIQRLENGSLIGVHKRCYAYTRKGKWLLSTGYKVGNLVTEWISQVQFAPQVVGYIEGGPPVPSENLTEGYYKTHQTFNGTSEVTINESEEVNYSISTSNEDSFSSGFEVEASLGLKLEPRIILAPLGIGVSKKVKVAIKSRLNFNMEANGSWGGGESIGSGQNVSRKMSAAIGGNWDVSDKTKPD